MKPNNKDTYLITLTCSLEGSTPILVNLNPYELNLVKFLENLSKKVAGDDLEKPYILLEKFPYDEYKKHKLSSFQQKSYKEILNANKKAYTRIKHEVEKQRRKANDTGNGVE